MALQFLEGRSLSDIGNFSILLQNLQKRGGMTFRYKREFLEKTKISLSKISKGTKKTSFFLGQKL